MLSMFVATAWQFLIYSQVIGGQIFCNLKQKIQELFHFDAYKAIFCSAYGKTPNPPQPTPPEWGPHPKPIPNLSQT